MFHGKMSDFVSFPLSGFTLVIKLRKFDFKGNWNTLIFSNKKMMSDLIMSCQKCLISVKLRYLSKILAISWEIQKF